MPLARFNLDGAAQDSFASGLRNPVGIAFRPGTDDLYVVVNERDGLGDGLVPDYFTRIRSGEFFGWPYAYSGPHPAPTWGARDPDLVALTKVVRIPFGADGPAPYYENFVTGFWLRGTSPAQVFGRPVGLAPLAGALRART